MLHGTFTPVLVTNSPGAQTMRRVPTPIETFSLTESPRTWQRKCTYEELPRCRARPMRRVPTPVETVSLIESPRTQQRRSTYESLDQFSARATRRVSTLRDTTAEQDQVTNGPRTTVRGSERVFVCQRSGKRVATGYLVTPSTAGGVLSQLISGTDRVDFPTVSNLCDRVEDNSFERHSVVRAIGQSLKTAKDRASLLKALTVAHELLYDSECGQALLVEPGLVSSLERISASREDFPAEEIVQLLTSEILRRLEPKSVYSL
mmetsp:Transcript_23500/g.61808  ORF Transcript_23500/g.61808 Transcript_23500/m.61808 type:complete len:262 (-) Transcript_23500:178-963(-)